jgi:TetR/AcrR family transcriptional regulator, cholesterol catabolism regulator
MPAKPSSTRSTPAAVRDRTVPMKSQLLRAGTMLFAERGFDATSVQAIVDAVGVTKGAFYHHFAAKEDLLYEIHADIMSTEARDAERILARRLDPSACLSLLIVSLIESIARFQPGVTVFLRDMHRLPPDKSRLVQEMRGEYARLFLRVISRGQVEGLFRSDMNADMVTYALLGSCNWFYTWYSPSGTWSAHELGQQVAGVYLNALQPIRPRIGDAFNGHSTRDTATS